MSTKSCAIALEWWLRKQGKFEGAKICTKQCNYDPKNLNVEPLFEITKWEVDGVPKPTDSEVNKIISDYETNYVAEKQNKEAKKEAIKTRLGLSDSEWEDLKEVIKD